MHIHIQIFIYTYPVYIYIYIYRSIYIYVCVCTCVYIYISFRMAMYHINLYHSKYPNHVNIKIASSVSWTLPKVPKRSKRKTNGSEPCLQDLEHKVENIRVCFLHLIEEHQTLAFVQATEGCATTCDSDIQLTLTNTWQTPAEVYNNYWRTILLGSGSLWHLAAMPCKFWTANHPKTVFLGASPMGQAAVRLSADAIRQLALLVIADVAGEDSQSAWTQCVAPWTRTCPIGSWLPETWQLKETPWPCPAPRKTWAISILLHSIHEDGEKWQIASNTPCPRYWPLVWLWFQHLSALVGDVTWASRTVFLERIQLLLKCQLDRFRGQFVRSTKSHVTTGYQSLLSSFPFTRASLPK